MLEKLLVRRVMWFVALLSFLVLSNCGSDPMAGAIGTGNAGRVQGQVVASSGFNTTRLSARLVSIDRAGGVVDSTHCDSTGLFRFPEHKTGEYRVEIWQGGKFHGSRSFHLAGDVTGLLIVLVEAVHQQELDLSKIGDVDSVFVDYRQNLGTKVGDRWIVQTTRDSAFVIHAHLGGTPGRWEEWMFVRRDGKDILVNLADNRSLDFERSIDSGAFLLTRHTVALWDFDSLRSKGTILDRSPFANDLHYEGIPELVSSPHGKAFAQSSGIAATVPSSGQLAPTLRWTRTGTMTWEIRFRMDSIPLAGMVVLGSQSGIRLWVTGSRQIVVESPVEESGGTVMGSVVSPIDAVPVGRWVDIAISVDGPSRQVYAWIDEKSQPLFVRTSWTPGNSLSLSNSGEFGIGGAAWDPRGSYFQLDEARISDTLVFGAGLPIQNTSTSNVTGSTLSESIQVFDVPGQSSCVDCQQVVVGLEKTTGRVGAYAWQPTLPNELQGKRVVSALLILWSANSPVLERKDFFVHPIRSSWNGGSGSNVWAAESGVRFGSMIDALPESGSLLVPGNSGGLVFEVSRIVQGWADNPKSNLGFLVRAADESHAGTNFFGAGAAQSPSLVLRYR
ncbi:MAG: hypothetical protein IPO40_09025 [Fibrobacteres bacterium]|nr:hypothetical protein [Fibrobacterota bacterium]